MIKLNTTIKELKMFLIFWSTQALSGLGSAMTNFALVIWAYQQTGTALLSICSYAPYVLCSIFAGALSERWNKRITMLVSDLFAAGCIVMTILPIPRSRVRIICNTLLISMSTEHFLLAFGKSVPVWCLGAVLGWMCIPIAIQAGYTQ